MSEAKLNAYEALYRVQLELAKCPRGALRELGIAITKNGVAELEALGWAIRAVGEATPPDDAAPTTLERLDENTLLWGPR